MSYTSYWKGNPNKTRKPSKKEASGAINTPGTALDGAWTLMDADANGSSPPTYAQPEPTRASPQASANDVTGHPLAVFHLPLSRRGSETHMPSVGFGCPGSGHRVGSLLLSFARFPCLLPSHARSTDHPPPRFAMPHRFA